MTSTNSTTTTSTTTGNSPRNGTTDDDDESSRSSSALRDNIARKGSHAYYFAHAHRANGPQWDGQPQPRLLSRGSTLTSETSSSHHSSTASNITTYAFHDNGNNVKLYVALEHVGERCSDEDISLDYTETSLSLMVRNYQPQPQCLRFGKLTAPIQSATWKKKDHRLILTIVKQEPREWHTIHDTGAPDHEVV